MKKIDIEKVRLMWFELDKSRVHCKIAYGDISPDIKEEEIPLTWEESSIALFLIKEKEGMDPENGSPLQWERYHQANNGLKRIIFKRLSREVAEGFYD